MAATDRRTNESGIEIKPVYAAEDVEHEQAVRRVRLALQALSEE